MKFEIFGKTGCARCKSAREKLEHLLGKADLADQVLVAYHDLDSVEGMAEGAFNDVRSIPTTILRSPSGEPLARWEGCLPPSVEVHALLGMSVRAAESPAAGPRAV